jgi:hypothetical protein
MFTFPKHHFDPGFIFAGFVSLNSTLNIYIADTIHPSCYVCKLAIYNSLICCHLFDRILLQSFFDSFNCGIIFMHCLSWTVVLCEYTIIFNSYYEYVIWKVKKKTELIILGVQYLLNSVILFMNSLFPIISRIYPLRVQRDGCIENTVPCCNSSSSPIETYRRWSSTSINFTHESWQIDKYSEMFNVTF